MTTVCFHTYMLASQKTCTHLTYIQIHRPYHTPQDRHLSYVDSCTNPQHQMGHRLVRTRRVVLGRVTRDTVYHRKSCSSTKMSGPQDMPRSSSAEASFRTDDTQLLRYSYLPCVSTSNWIFAVGKVGISDDHNMMLDLYIQRARLTVPKVL